MQLEWVIAIVSGLITLAASFLIAVYQFRTEFRKLLGGETVRHPESDACLLPE